MRNRKERRKDESERSQSHAKPSLLLVEDGNPNHITKSTARAHPSFNYVSISFPTLFQFFPTVCSSEIHFADWGEFVAELNRMIGGEMERLPGGPCSLSLSLSLPCPMAKLAGIFFSTGLTRSGRKEDENPTDEEPEAPPLPPPTTSRGPMGVKPHHPMIKAEGGTREREES